MTESPLQAESGSLSRPRPWAAAFTILCAGFLTLALPLAAPTLNAVGISGLPLGYYFAAQGGLLLVALLGLWLSGPWRVWSLQERIGAFLASLSATGGWLTAGVALTLVGGLFVFGHDGLPLLLGLASGLLVSLVFIAPALDRAGALHVDDLLARLTSSTFASAAAGLGMSAGLVMLMSIELEVLELAVSSAFDDFGTNFGSADIVGIAAALSVILSFTPGRRFRAVVVTLAFLAMTAGIWFAIWAVDGHAPGALVPQLAYGEALAELTKIERTLLTDGLADPVSMPPFARPFVQVSWLNFVTLTLSMMLGASVLPHMLWRRKAAAGRTGPAQDGEAAGDFYPSRHKAAFGLITAALVLSALPAAAVFAKLELYKSVATGIANDSEPHWMRSAVEAGYLRVCKRSVATAVPSGETAASLPSLETCGDASGRLRIADLTINPAAVVLMMPSIAGISAPWPKAFSIMIALLALLAAAATLRMAAEAATGWLVIRHSGEATGGFTAPAPIGPRLLVAALFAALATAAVVLFNESAVNRLYWSFSLLGASVFPMVLLTVLVPRVNGIALALGGLTGLAVCLYYVIGTTSIFAPQFALFWASASDAPPWLLEELDGLMQLCASGGEDAEVACRGALDLGRELANWFGIDGRAGAAIGAPTGLLVAFLAALLMPSTWRAHQPDEHQA